jgi:hypothetical protein
MTIGVCIIGLLALGVLKLVASLVKSRQRDQKGAGDE